MGFFESWAVEECHISEQLADVMCLQVLGKDSRPSLGVEHMRGGCAADCTDEDI